MMRLTGTMLFSILCLLPLGAEGVTKTPPLKECGSGSFFCNICGECKPTGSDCDSAHCYHKPKVIPLKKKEGVVYSLEEGAVLSCEGERPLLPITVAGKTHWTCGAPEKK